MIYATKPSDRVGYMNFECICWSYKDDVLVKVRNIEFWAYSVDKAKEHFKELNLLGSAKNDNGMKHVYVELIGNIPQIVACRIDVE